MARASARGFSFGTTLTSYPKISLSSTPPGLSAVMTGVPDASASSATVGHASSSDGSTNASAAASNRAMAWLSTRPAKVTCPSTPLVRATTFSSSSSGPVPQMISRVSGCVRTTSPSASSR